MKYVKIVMVILGFFFVFACNIKPRGWWKESVIAVMADSTDWALLQGSLRSTFEHVIRTPQIEKTYSVKYVKDEEFTQYTEFRYLILAATLQSKGRIGEIVQRVITDPEIRRGVEEGEYYVFTQSNQWAKDQLMVILVGRDIPSLREKIETNSPFLYAIFDTDFNHRCKEDMLEGRTNKKLEESLMSKYNWTIKLQRDFFLSQELATEGFAWFRRTRA